jgi:hypothetical protein
MPLYPELATLSFAELLTAFEQPRYPDGATFYQEVAIAIRAAGDLGLGFLLGKLTTSRTMQLRGAILGVTFPPAQERALATHIQHSIQQLIGHPHPLVAMEAIDALCLLGDRTPAAIVLGCAHHKSPYVRGAVARYVAALVPDHIKTVVLPALQDPHYIVRESAIDALDETNRVDARKAIQPLLSDPHPHVRQAAETALAQLRHEMTTD